MANQLKLFEVVLSTKDDAERELHKGNIVYFVLE
jgi:hypothetical protein